MNASDQGPSDLELMQLVDGELDDARSEELTRDISDEARDKLAALALVGELICEGAEADTCADDLADLVLAKIERDELPELEDRDLPVAPGSSEADLEDEPASGVRGGRDEDLRTISSDRGQPANDNARRIFVLAALAAAVAAGLMVWGRTDPGLELATQRRDPAAFPAAFPTGHDPTAPDSTGPSPASSQVAVLEAEPNDAVPSDQPGVEVAAVDFRNSSGAVFYVEGAPDEPQTTVVWVTDEAGDD